MGKVELKLEIDADLLERARARGAEPARLLEEALRAAAESLQPLDWADSAREKIKDPGGAGRRAREWAEANKEAITEHNAWVAEHGHLSDYPFFKPAWAR